jgi:chemotaxis protein methyltransferase CheR
VKANDEESKLEPTANPSGVEALELELLLQAVHQRYGSDFRQYARISLARRVRSAMQQLNCETVSELQGRVLRDSALFTKLVHAIVVPVTMMFRDPEFFLYFRNHIVPQLRTFPFVRIWVAGCSTGEEAYSYAIILREEGLLERTVVYATDINGEALRRAKLGVYGASQFEEFSRSHALSGATVALSAHCQAACDAVIMDRSLRERILFAEHSLATDAEFAEVHVVSCRNVLIYFEAELQARAVNVMSRALCRQGFIGVGVSESVRRDQQHNRLRVMTGVAGWLQKQ